MSADQPEPQQPDPDDLIGDGQAHDSAAPDWHSLPAPDRAAFVVAEASAGRWLPLMRQPLDDDVLDVMAAVRAVRQDNLSALATILRTGNHAKMVVTAVKIIAEMAVDSEVSDEYLAVYSSYAAERD